MTNPDRDMTTDEFIDWLKAADTPEDAARELRSRGWKPTEDGRWMKPNHSARPWQEAILSWAWDGRRRV